MEKSKKKFKSQSKKWKKRSSKELWINYHSTAGTRDISDASRLSVGKYRLLYQVINRWTLFIMLDPPNFNTNFERRNSGNRTQVQPKWKAKSFSLINNLPFISSKTELEQLYNSIKSDQKQVPRSATASTVPAISLLAQSCTITVFQVQRVIFNTTSNPEQSDRCPTTSRAKLRTESPKSKLNKT